MIDIQLLRRDLDWVSSRLLSRGTRLDKAIFFDLEAQRKSLQSKTEDLQATRNQYSREIGVLKKSGKDVSEHLKEVSDASTKIKELETELSGLQKRLRNFLSDLPNIPHISVPEGLSEADNQEMRRIGQVPNFDFEVRDHTDIGNGLGLLDFEVAATIAGSRFMMLAGDLARLHRSLSQFMLDIHTIEHGYTETYVPYLVNEQSLFGTGQLPKFEEDLFAVKKMDGSNFFLIPTAEVPVTNIVSGKILDLDKLPLKYVAHTPCFRSEAGSYGRDTRGMIRQHQFDKVELVQVTQPTNSYSNLEDLTSHAEEILKRLGLPYRVVLLCSSDMGFSAAKTYDLEVWLPSQNCFREVSSCSNFEDFQARRMRARFRNKEGKPELVHTLNGSGLAVGRTLVAVLENYQESDGSVSVPEVLRSYMGGIKKIESKKIS